MERERGSVALFGIMMMMLLGAMGATLLALSKTDIQIAINHRDGIAAQYLAEAGIQDAVSKLKTDQDFVIQTSLENYTTTSQSLGITPTTGSYIVEIGPDSTTSNKNNRIIKAIGIVNQATRQVIANVTLAVPTGEGTAVVIIWKN